MADVGAALYGDAWLTPLARDLGIGNSFLLCMRKGSKLIPGRYWPMLAELAQRRIAALEAKHSELEKHAYSGTEKHAYLGTCGVLLYAEGRWREGMARDLAPAIPHVFRNESLNTQRKVQADLGAKFRRMTRGEQDIPDEVWPALRRLIASRLQTLAALLPQLQDIKG